ncbi:hypothetical protein G9A89_013908 [Geosiphon pyriformis]|nr:hypothetical protein G9A89_013908 [Geosiphon pyriformis]
MDNDEVVFLPRLSISLEKKWIDPKIIKTLVQWFWGATTSSKFEEIIQSMFTSEKSMKKAALLAEKEEIIVNNNVKKQGLRSDRAVVIKKISMDTPKDMIIAAVSEFGIIKSIKIQLVGMWQKAVVEFADLDQAV